MVDVSDVAAAVVKGELPQLRPWESHPCECAERTASCCCVQECTRSCFSAGSWSSTAAFPSQSCSQVRGRCVAVFAAWGRGMGSKSESRRGNAPSQHLCHALAQWVWSSALASSATCCTAATSGSKVRAPSCSWRCRVRVTRFWGSCMGSSLACRRHGVKLAGGGGDRVPGQVHAAQRAPACIHLFSCCRLAPHLSACLLPATLCRRQPPSLHMPRHHLRLHHRVAVFDILPGSCVCWPC